ncbi:Cystic fibrosis transmembrane conductance regulator [Hirschfeldia incana]|nr:Cystic fibrosis transmembrane conductance regulator [Hirschfeldia incana]
MAGIFSRLPVSRSGHRRTQSDTDELRALPPNTALVASLNNLAGSTHGIEVATEFKLVEHPVEPLDNDQPIQCPLPEPSILNDGRIWKERVSASTRRRGELAIAQDGVDVESDGSVTKRSPSSQRNPNRRFSPSLSAPEHHMLNLLDECKASGTI